MSGDPWFQGDLEGGYPSNKRHAGDGGCGPVGVERGGLLINTPCLAAFKIYCWVHLVPFCCGSSEMLGRRKKIIK